MATFDEDLIDNVKKYPILYRSKVKNLQQLMQRENCWKEIAFTLNRTPDECKTKWRNIRDGYKKNKKKKNTGVPSMVSKYDDERLKFISESEEDNVDICNANNNMDGIKEEYETFDDVSLSETQYTLQAPNEYALQSNCSSVINPDMNPDQHSNEDQDPNRRKVMKRKLMAGGNDFLVSPTHKFFSSMADIVCKFPPEKIADIRMRVCNMVSEMELVLLTERNQTDSETITYYKSSSSNL